jgi:folate-binding protein YgfZ
MDDIPYSKIAVTGEDAFDFLQAQLAADLADLSESGLSAWCNPKGRVICLFRVQKTDDGFDLALPTELADAVLRRLTMFRFRSKVEFQARAMHADQSGTDGDYESWRLTNLKAGVPEILEAQSEEFTPHMLNLDLLHAVSVSKGCYPGQEIVARTHFRGATKRRMLRFESESPVQPGDKVSLDGRDVGEVLNAVGRDLLAVVPVANAGDALTVNGVQLTNLPLPYLE